MQIAITLAKVARIHAKIAMARLPLAFPARIGIFLALPAWLLAQLDIFRIIRVWSVLLVRLDVHSVCTQLLTALHAQADTIISIILVSVHVQQCIMLILRLLNVLPVLGCAAPASAPLFVFLATPTSFGTAAAWLTLNALPLTLQT